jgi:hypothetical protein
VSRLVPAAAASLLVGVVLMVVWDATLTRVVGVLALFCFLALGVFAIASPEFLSGDED